MADEPHRGPAVLRLDSDDDRCNFTSGLPSKQYDALCHVAQRHRVSVPEVVRRAVRVLSAESAPDTTSDE